MWLHFVFSVFVKVTTKKLGEWLCWRCEMDGRLGHPMVWHTGVLPQRSFVAVRSPTWRSEAGASWARAFWANQGVAARDHRRHPLGPCVAALSQLSNGCVGCHSQVGAFRQLGLACSFLLARPEHGEKSAIRPLPLLSVAGPIGDASGLPSRPPPPLLPRAFVVHGGLDFRGLSPHSL